MNSIHERLGISAFSHIQAELSPKWMCMFWNVKVSPPNLLRTWFWRKSYVNVKILWPLKKKKAHWVKLTEHLKSWFIWIHSLLSLDLLRFDSHFEHLQFNLGIGQLHKEFDSIQLKIIESNLKLNLSWIESVHLWQDVSPGDDGHGFLLSSGVVSTWGKGKQHSTKLSKVRANK